MSTRAYDNTRALADGIEDIFDSAVCSGIVGDRRHTGGYHISREDQSKTNYSVVRSRDRAGNGPDDASAGIDMSMNRRDMILATARLKRVFDNRHADPRARYINAFNGTLDGRTARRWDVAAGKVQDASDDHTWHLHGEQPRLYVRSKAATTAWLSALRGHTIAQYLTAIGGTAPAPAGKVAPAAPAYPRRVLRRNDRQTAADPAVRQWQQAARTAGFTAIGAADGYFGRKTEGVVRRLQAVFRVAVDGEIGPVTWPLPWRAKK